MWHKIHLEKDWCSVGELKPEGWAAPLLPVGGTGGTMPVGWHIFTPLRCMSLDDLESALSIEFWGYEQISASRWIHKNEIHT